VTSPAAPVLLAALDAEWAAQSERTRPLVATPFVREALVLAVAGSREGIFGLAGAMNADTPDALVRQVEDLLPAAPDPWTLRLLGRLRSLPTSPEPPRLEEAGTPEDEPASLRLTSPVVFEPASTAPPRRRRMVAAALVSGTAGGLALAVLVWLAGAGG
jgi:hypothetical protein